MSKRLLDIAIVLLAAPLWLPLLVACSIALLIAGGGRVFFVQQRPGLNERPFNLYKFRTMNNARGDDGDLLDDAQRLTGVGRFLRSTSLDEIPQLLNVLRGDMSLVGPRPLLMEYLPLYPPKHRRRHEVRPGITGLAQINGRNLLSWDERFDLDVEYVDSQSLLLDLRILLATVGNVLRRHGISADNQATMSRYRGPGS